MPSRRFFIKTVTGAAAGLAMGRSFPDADAQGPRGGQGREQVPQTAGPVTRREVQVGGRRVRVVDVHAHATVDEVKPVVANTEFARNAGGRPLDMERIQEMDRRGIDVQVLSINGRSEEHTSELQSQSNLVCRLLLEKKKKHRQPPRS